MDGIRHFQKVGALDAVALAALASEVDLAAPLFGRQTWRESAPGSPHRDTEALYLRMPAEITLESVFHSLDCRDTPLMEREAFARAVATVCRGAGAAPARALIVRLKPGGRITPHIDEGLYAAATHRWHVAIRTNEQAWLVSGDERVHMAPGEVWWFDKHALHFGANEGEGDRVHLIVDTFR